jgi:UDP-3-O-[3-hydroxymyristoyl] N-acetylglucosamine deacetylase
MEKQHTIAQPIAISGVAVHSGNLSAICIKPAACNAGIVFKRIDLANNNEVKALYSAVVDTSMCTVIANQHGVRIATIEHLMAALWGCGIDNAIVEINAEEVPIMDGSSKVFVEQIERVGKVKQSSKKKCIALTERIAITHDDGYIILEPDDHFSITCGIAFNHPAIGEQELLFDSKIHSFSTMLSASRTFGFKKDLVRLNAIGLAKGASLENSVGIDENGIMNADGLRYEDEFVRHKLLDCIGDLYLAGATINAKVKSFKSGHKMNNQVLHALFANLALSKQSGGAEVKVLPLEEAS